MTLYRDTTTGKIWTDGELTTSLADEIAGLDDEDSLKQEVEERGDAAIYDYIIECCLVGIYSRVDDGEAVAYRRTLDGQVFYAAEMEDVFYNDISKLVKLAWEQYPPGYRCYRRRWQHRTSAAKEEGKPSCVSNGNAPTAIGDRDRCDSHRRRTDRTR